MQRFRRLPSMILRSSRLQELSLIFWNQSFQKVSNCSFYKRFLITEWLDVFENFSRSWVIMHFARRTEIFGKFIHWHHAVSRDRIRKEFLHVFFSTSIGDSLSRLQQCFHPAFPYWAQLTRPAFVLFSRIYRISCFTLWKIIIPLIMLLNVQIYFPILYNLNSLFFIKS